MMEFFKAVAEFQFLQHALLAGLLAGIGAGIVGSLVVVRRTASVAGAIAHCVLGGLGAARYLEKVWGVTWADPMLGAVIAALMAAVVINYFSHAGGEREDTVIAAIWAVGMAGGLLFIAATPGYSEDLMSYLFGNILLVRTNDLWMMVGLDALILVVVFARFPEIQALCFDEEYARLRGLHVDRLSLLLHVLTALTVVLLVSVVGIVLVIALLTLPVAIAGRFGGGLRRMMVTGALLSVAFSFSGLFVSFRPDLPAGAVTILIAGGVYFVVGMIPRGFFSNRTGDT